MLQVVDQEPSKDVNEKSKEEEQSNAKAKAAEDLANYQHRLKEIVMLELIQAPVSVQEVERLRAAIMLLKEGIIDSPVKLLELSLGKHTDVKGIHLSVAWTFAESLLSYLTLMDTHLAPELKKIGIAPEVSFREAAIDTFLAIGNATKSKEDN